MRSNLRHSWLCAATAAIHALTQPAHAEPSVAATSEPDAARKQRAEAHVRAGTEAFERKDYGTAITELNAAYDEAHDSSLLYAIGQAYRVSGDCAHAVTAYRAFLESNPPERQREAAKANLERCESAAPAPAPRPTEAAAPASAVAPLPAPTPVPPKAEPPPLVTSSSGNHRAWYEDVPGDVLTGTGGVALIVGVVLFAGGKSRVSDADSVTTDGAFRKTRGDADGGLTEQRVGLIAMGAGAALVTAGIVRYVSVGKETQSASIRVAPAPLGVVAVGVF